MSGRTPFVDPRSKQTARLIGLAIALAVMWGLYLISLLGNVDPIGWLHGDSHAGRGKDALPPTVYLVLAVVGTIVLTIWTLVKNRGTFNLAKNGVRVEGRVTKIGIIGRAGMVPVTIAYPVDGVERKIRVDLPKDSELPGRSDRDRRL